MFDFHTLAEFSRANCISICAFLVPANLVATSATIIFTLLRRPSAQVLQAAAIASIFALVMIWHVFTWFEVGVVLAPTYILLWLGSTCLFANLGAIILHRRLMLSLQIPPNPLLLPSHLNNTFIWQLKRAGAMSYRGEKKIGNLIPGKK